MARTALTDALDALRPLPDPIRPLPEPPPERFTRRGLSLRPAPLERETDTIALADLPELLMDATTRYLQTSHPAHMLLIAAPPGAGKTYHAVRLAEQVAAGGRHVLYAGPRRAFWRDVQREQQRPHWWYAWKPRHQGDLTADPPLAPTCRWAPDMAQWLVRGYDAIDFCSNPRICGWDYVNERCPYHAQKQRGEPVIFGQHAHVALGHPLMDRFGLVIGDELPLDAFLHRWTIPLTQIVPRGMADPGVETLLRNLRALCTVPADTPAGWEGRALYEALPGGAAGVLDALASVPHDATDIGAWVPELRSAAAADDAPFFHLLPLARLMVREATRLEGGLDVIPRVRCGPEGLTLRLRHAPATLPPHLIWLDATGDAGIYQALFGRPVEVLRPRIRMTGRIFQVWAATNNRGAVLDERPGQDGQPIGTQTQARIRAQIRRIIETEGYQTPAAISYKALNGQLLDHAPSAHFGATRGTNALQDVDVLFVVGAPLPTLSALKETAAMLFFERDEPFRDDWHALDIPFVGQAAAHSVGGFWDDPDLTTVLRQVRESEIVQAVHRARPLRRPVDVWLLTNVVTDLPVELVSLHALFDALDADGKPIPGIDVLRWPEVVALAATPDHPLTVARMAAELAVSPSTAKRWWQALRTTGQYTLAPAAPGAQRGPKPQGLVKHFEVPK